MPDAPTLLAGAAFAFGVLQTLISLSTRLAVAELEVRLTNAQQERYEECSKRFVDRRDLRALCRSQGEEEQCSTA